MYLNYLLIPDGIHEDWPFYTQEERHTLKRRKPQNLTPESDTGSTSSGHFPGLLHQPLLPAQITMTSGSLKRHSYYDPGAEQPVPKKKRVSHFKRETPTTRLSSGLGWGSGGHSPAGGTSPNSPRLAPHSPNLSLPASFTDSVQQPEWGPAARVGARLLDRAAQPQEAEFPAPVSPKPPAPTLLVQGRRKRLQTLPQLSRGRLSQRERTTRVV